jgi:DNA-binding NtrC family response regulator
MTKNVVLLVDNESEIAAMLQMILENAGFSVLTACSPAEAMEIWMVNRDRIHTLITDLEMDSDLAGYHLANQLRSEKPHLRTIVMSGHPLPLWWDQRGESMEFLQKPFDMSELIQIVNGHPSCQAA